MANTRNNNNTGDRRSSRNSSERGEGNDRKGGGARNFNKEKGSEDRLKPAEMELKEKMVALNRVAKVTKGGTYF